MNDTFVQQQHSPHGASGLCRCLLIIAVIFFGITTVRPAFANNHLPVILEKKQEAYPLGKHLDILEDSTGGLTIEDVVREPFSAKFIANQDTNPNFGFTPSVYWIRFSLKENLERNKTWLLEIAYPLFDHINVYFPADDGEYLEKKAGDLLPFKDREIINRNFVFRLPPSALNGQQIYLRFQTESTMNIPLTLWSENAFAKKDHNAQFGLGLYYGFILLMTLYSLLMWAMLRDNNYFFYLFFSNSKQALLLLWNLHIVNTEGNG